jgi:hypothetical protein
VQEWHKGGVRQPHHSARTLVPSGLGFQLQLITVSRFANGPRDEARRDLHFLHVSAAQGEISWLYFMQIGLQPHKKTF